MPDKRKLILLPFACPDTTALRNAQAAILSDIQRETGDTYAEIAQQIDVHPNTVANWANKLTDMGALTIAKIGAIYGKEYVRPYETLYTGGETGQGINPLPEMARAVSILANMDKGTPKQKLDALTAMKEANAAMCAFIAEVERMRLA